MMWLSCNLHVSLAIYLFVVAGSAGVNECVKPVSRWIHAQYGGVGDQPLWRREEAAAEETSQAPACLSNSRRREESKEVVQA